MFSNSCLDLPIDSAALAGIDIEGIQPYIFKPDNPFMDDLESYSRAKKLFRDGILSEAVYALEAEASNL